MLYLKLTNHNNIYIDIKQRFSTCMVRGMLSGDVPKKISVHKKIKWNIIISVIHMTYIIIILKFQKNYNPTHVK